MKFLILQKLVQDGVIKTVLPEEYIYLNPEACYKFLNYIEENKQSFHLPNIQNIPNNRTSRLYNLHIGKLGLIGNELELRNLARRVNEQWYEVSFPLAMSFMTFLAILIGQELDYIPTTDTYRGFSALFNVEKNNPYANSRVIRNKLRNTILDEILPVPSVINEWTDIIRFKERYGTNLIRFRQNIEDFIISIDGLSNELQIERHKNFINQANDEIEEIREQLRWFKSPEINTGTLLTALPGVIGLISGKPTNASGLLGVIHNIFYNSKRNTARKRPLAYAAIYKQKYHRDPKRL